MSDFDHEVDVVVVGSGGGGMVAAWTARCAGLDVLVIEKAAQFGGNTALSGGGAWLPNAAPFERLGETDDPEALYAYLRAIAPDVAPERHRAYLNEIPRMVRALEEDPQFADGKGMFWINGYSDYFPDQGGNPKGRGLWSSPIDERALGPLMTTRRGHGAVGRIPGAPRGMYMTSYDYHELLTIAWGAWAGRKALLRLGWRSLMSRLTGRKIVAGGAALTTRLRMMLRDRGVPLWLETPLRDLISDKAGAVTGVIADHGGRQIRIGARKGVIIAAGGFEANREMRSRYQPDARYADTQGSADNMGDWLAPATQIGAATDLMDDAWWSVGMRVPNAVWGILAERQYPHQFIVNADGRRFLNESQPYTAFGHAMIAANKTGASTFPSYMILDSFAWKNYMFRGLPGRRMPEEWLTSGLVKKADTIEELARQIGVPPENLVATTERFNQFARTGRDLDFHRGDSIYDNWHGNPHYRNPNLGEVKVGPLYAFTIVLSDLGTKGGLLTDANARVLNGKGTPIPGLYATGNCSASVMGNSYAGPGATIGPAMVFGWVAGNHVSGSNH